jgi:hypothetical protein
MSSIIAALFPGLCEVMKLPSSLRAWSCLKMFWKNCVSAERGKAQQVSECKPRFEAAESKETDVTFWGLKSQHFPIFHSRRKETLCNSKSKAMIEQREGTFKRNLSSFYGEVA